MYCGSGDIGVALASLIPSRWYPPRRAVNGSRSISSKALSGTRKCPKGPYRTVIIDPQISPRWPPLAAMAEEIDGQVSLLYM